MAQQNSNADQVGEAPYDRAAEVAGLAEKRGRKKPTLREKLASALLTICRPDEYGRLVPVISPEEAKQMTAREIIARFEFDHGVLHALGGSNHPTNFTPRPVSEHREKSRLDTSIVAKVRRIAPEHERFRRVMLAKADPGVAPAPVRQKTKIGSRGFSGSRKFNGSVTWRKWNSQLRWR